MDAKMYSKMPTEFFFRHWMANYMTSLTLSFPLGPASDHQRNAIQYAGGLKVVSFIYAAACKILKKFDVTSTNPFSK